jgi:hypothetical protein
MPQMPPVTAHLDEHLKAVAGLAKSGRIHLLNQLALSEGETPVPSRGHPMRVGVYPLAANPMHRGHVLVGLTAMATIGLDEVIFIIAGADRRKPSILSADTRHRLCRLLAMNPALRMDAFYIAGAHHYRRPTPAEKTDTIVVSAVFVDGNGEGGLVSTVGTSLDVRMLPPIPLSLCSTDVRKALCMGELCEALFRCPMQAFSKSGRPICTGKEASARKARIASQECTRDLTFAADRPASFDAHHFALKAYLMRSPAVQSFMGNDAICAVV